MKPISIHVAESDYQELKSLAARQKRPVAEVIREAMTEYLVRSRRSGDSLLALSPHPSGELLEGWSRSQLYDEMLDR